MFLALIITVVLECFFSFIFFSKLPKRNVLLVVLAANLLTNPMLNFFIALNNAFFHIYSLNVLTLEIVVIIFEAFIYSKFLNRNFLEALAVSFILNLISVIVGLMVVSFVSTLFFTSFYEPKPFILEEFPY